MQTWPSGQHVWLAPVPHTRAVGQHVPPTQVVPVSQHVRSPLARLHATPGGVRFLHAVQAVTHLWKSELPAVNPAPVQKVSHVGTTCARALATPKRLSSPPPNQPSACRREMPAATALASVS